MSQRRTEPLSRDEFIHLLGNEKRVQLLVYLWECDCTETTEIAREIGTIPNTVLPHCKKLQDARLLRKRKRNGATFWHLTGRGEKAAGKIARPMIEVAPDS